MREEIASYDEVFARFRGARLYEIDEGGVAYLAEHAGAPCFLVRPRVSEPDVIVLEFEDEHERAAYLAARSAVSPSVPVQRPSGCSEDAPAAREARSDATRSHEPLPAPGS